MKVTPAVGTDPPGTLTSREKLAETPTTWSPSHARNVRSSSRTPKIGELMSSSLNPSPKAVSSTSDDLPQGRLAVVEAVKVVA